MRLGEKGVVPVLILVAALGLVAFLIFASTIQFKGGLFATLFPKRSSFASGPISGPVGSGLRVFVTSNVYSGDLGGLTGADNKCQQSASAANLGGAWKAWLSDSNISAASHLEHSTVPYKLVNGTVIANNWNDLTDGSISYPINLTEQGVAISSPTNFTWTNTLANGNRNPSGFNCSNWTLGSFVSPRTSANVGDTGTIGNLNTNASWTEVPNGDATCDNKIRLYCFEQSATYSESAYYTQSGYATPQPTPTPTPTPYTQAGYATPTPKPTPTPIGGGSVVKIYAAGTPANGIYPNMQFLINNVNYQNFFGVTGVAGGFREYSFTAPFRLTTEHIAVRFTNDYYVGPGNDRNLIVDKINIDGVEYQSEAPLVYGTGVWNASTGHCASGNFQTEWLVCNGVFWYR